MEAPRLSKRLSAVADLLPESECIADVGCDHGKLGLSLLLTNRCQTLIALEISEPSLNKARRLFRKYGMEHRVQCQLHNGLPDKGAAQAAVIAGIGGNNTLDILKRGIQCAAGMKTLVLQPSNDAATLRSGLWELGFVFIKESIVHDKRYFPMMAVVYDGVKRPPMDPLICEIGPCNMRMPGKEVLEYVDWRIRVLKKSVQNCAKTEAGRQRQKEIGIRAARLLQWRKENTNASDT